MQSLLKTRSIRIAGFLNINWMWIRSAPCIPNSSFKKFPYVQSSSFITKLCCLGKHFIVMINLLMKTWNISCTVQSSFRCLNHYNTLHCHFYLLHSWNEFGERWRLLSKIWSILMNSHVFLSLCCLIPVSLLVSRYLPDHAPACWHLVTSHGV